MFRRQPVVGRNDFEAGPGTKLGAEIVMAVEAAEDKTATVEIDDRRPPRVCGTIAPDGDRAAGKFDRGILDAQCSRTAGMEGRAHAVVERTLCGQRLSGD